MTDIFVAANNGTLGGGEVMLLRVAQALVRLGYAVRVVAPEQPGEVAELADRLGLRPVVVAAHGRRSYMRELRRWDRRRSGLLWCNGLVPAVATAGHPRRLVHLHQPPEGMHRAALAVGRWRVPVVLVPSEFMRRQVPHSVVLLNWTDDIWVRRQETDGPPVVIGCLGQVGLAKGVDVLAKACSLLTQEQRHTVHLLVAGDDRSAPPQDRAVVDAALASAGVVVRRTGWMARDDFFAEVEVAAFPSVAEEAFGLVAAEAMAAGVPLVVSDSGAFPEVVGADYPWIVPRGDAAGLARTLGEALATLPAHDLAARMRARWEDEYSPAAGERRLARLMEQLARHRLVESARQGPVGG